MSPHSIFGWSYPPGCSGVPDDYDGISPQSEEIYGILEDAGCEQIIIDRICKIVDSLAYDAVNCPECEKRAAEAEAKFYEQIAKANKEVPMNKPKKALEGDTK